MAIRLRLDDLENLAQELGYADYHSMLYDLYVIQGEGLHTIGERCHIHYMRVRRHLLRFGIKIRGKGGATSVKIVMTKELIEEIRRDGIPAVAERLGVSPMGLLTRAKQVDPTDVV